MQVTMPLNNTVLEHRLKRIHNHGLPVRGRNNSRQDEDTLQYCVLTNLTICSVGSPIALPMTKKGTLSDTVVS